MDSRSSFFFNDTATTEIYTLALHDALPICRDPARPPIACGPHEEPRAVHDRRDREGRRQGGGHGRGRRAHRARSEEHTSELQSRQYLVCRLLLEKKKNRFLPCTAKSHRIAS